MITTLLLTLTLAAHADVASSGPESCTVEKKEQDGTACESCSSWYGAGEDDTAGETCEDQYAGTAFTYVCSTDGASTWTEVWCDGPPKEGCGGCSAAGVTGVSWLAGLGLVGLVGLRRRREG